MKVCDATCISDAVLTYLLYTHHHLFLVKFKCEALPVMNRLLIKMSFSTFLSRGLLLCLLLNITLTQRTKFCWAGCIRLCISILLIPFFSILDSLLPQGMGKESLHVELKASKEKINQDKNEYKKLTTLKEI